MSDEELAQIFCDAAWSCELEDGTPLCCYVAGIRAVRAHIEAQMVVPS